MGWGLSGLFLWLCCGLWLQTRPALLQSPSELLHHVLSDFTVVRPIRTDSEGRVLSDPAPRQKRHAPWPRPPEQEVFFNLTLQGAELQLHLRINTQVMAPGATLLWEESGVSEPITKQHCLYSGHASNDSRITAVLSICKGLEGLILSPFGDFYIEPVLKNCSGSDQDHVVYRDSDLTPDQNPANQSAARESPPTDFLRGPVLGPEVQRLRSWSDPVQTLKRRRRRSREAELFHIEVLLAVDYSVLLFHGRENIQRYLLTFMHIVNEIYQEPSLGANINIVLVQIVLLSPTKSQELISVGDPQKSLQKVCTWSYLHQRDQQEDQKHDHTIYLSRQEFGPSGMQGYAPVTGMCRLIRSCVLVMDDGFSSAFVAAHETGHVLGMEHDGDANNCDDDVHMGSIMSPQVQASFYRYHWSTCSWRELHQHLDSYECLRDDPFLASWPPQPQLPGFSYSMDQQCQYDWGPGFTTCTTYTVSDPCAQLWCSHYNDPFYCKTKKGPPLDGTRCGPGQHCFRGRCVYLAPHMMRTHGSWGKWSPFGSCSRSCASGVQFRTRICDSPRPANGGRPCFGNSYEFRLCNQDTPCPLLTDFRAEQCKVWNPFFEHNGTKHHWLPLEHPDPDERCRLFCVSAETGAVVNMDRVLHDGTLCSYEDQHSVCVRGDCEHVGCDGQIASDRAEDRCGVCGGDNSSCKVIKGNFTRSTRKNGFLKILEIPKGARHLLVQEFKSTPHVLAVKNMDTGHVFLNDEHHLPESRGVVEGGVAWQYVNEEGVESVQTSGPLSSSVLLMVRSHGSDGSGKVTVSYKYILQEALRSGLDSNLVLEDAMFFEWALKRWSSCSRPCGGGKQYTRFGCRRKADGKMVHRMFCSNVTKPRAISRICNRDECSRPEWTVGPWQPCSASCGTSGWQRRWVSCQQVSSGGQPRSVPSKLCSADKPESKRSCNRHTCPAAWRGGAWGQCSVSCGGSGTQERQVKCLSPDGAPGNCSAPRPVTTQSCLTPPCSGEQRNSIVRWLSRSSPDSVPRSNQRCRGDRSVFCQMEVLTRYCSLPGYRDMCCVSCGKLNTTLSNTTLSNTTLSNTTLSNTTLNSSIPHNNSTDPPPREETSLTTLPPDDITTEAPPPDDVTPEAPPPDDITTEAPPPDDVTPEAPPPDDITTEAPPPDDVTPEAPPPDDITTEAPPPDHITDFIYVEYEDDYGDFSSLATDVSDWTDSPAAATTTNTTTTTPYTTTTVTTTTHKTTTPKRARKPSRAEPGASPAPPVDPEVQYRVVGVTVATQNEFVQRKPPRFREKTQNKRIQELLREKRRRMNPTADL
ncbi:A disintegrin and metalloproteinase with thrombospondin motifs 2-like isoform X1 [Periophthalmus magnuspinnatus]|uniref:A disintegrin and metalloproteinase with thrombospondin motifs 2-like isoform X1 n=1 Tax=Periophthalmus magnuspinnatus TaxID=409849 RepID=UPI0024365EBD|nr:A disintegrin and metalloproteinase with thrombospondin motifs 2-like isoform X1 [Periophthalmus magnuspinnatus]